CWSTERSVASSRTAYDLGNRLRRLALPVTIQSWALTSLRQRLCKTGGRLGRHARSFEAPTGREPRDAAPVCEDPRAQRATRTRRDTYGLIRIGGSMQLAAAAR